MKFTSKFNHSFTNRGCLHCAILKVYKARDMHFFPSKCLTTFINMFINMKFIRVAYWINSEISNRDKNTTLMIFLFCNYCWSLLWCNYWRSLMLWNSTSWSRLKLTVQIQLALNLCNPFLINNRKMAGDSLEK